MGRIFYLMGKSSSGKDTIYRKLLENQGVSLKTVVLYTTRPIRVGEEDGKEYFFIDDAKVEELLQEHKVIELRSYNTFHGIWKYMTVDDGRIDIGKNDYLIIGTLESYNKMLEYFGNGKVIPILVELDDGERLQRALDRERAQSTPKYQEMCRRFLADAEDFSKERIAESGITQTFYNGDLQQCTEQIINYISSF